MLGGDAFWSGLVFLGEELEESGHGMDAGGIEGYWKLSESLVEARRSSFESRRSNVQRDPLRVTSTITVRGSASVAVEQAVTAAESLWPASV